MSKSATLGRQGKAPTNDFCNPAFIFISGPYKLRRMGRLEGVLIF